jgi:hypothetical protein
VVVQHRLGASDHRAGLILPRKSNRIKAGQRGQQGISYRRSVRNALRLSGTKSASSRWTNTR